VLEEERFCRGLNLQVEQNMKVRSYLSVFWPDFADYFVNLSTLEIGIGGGSIFDSHVAV
jgi:hypothetical protein